MPPNRSSRTALQQQRKRRVLGELDTNTDLNVPRRPTKRRAPIVFGQENEHAVVDGIRRGIYDYNEVVALTDSLNFDWYAAPTESTTPTAPTRDVQDMEEEQTSDLIGSPEPVTDLPEQVEDPEGDHDEDAYFGDYMGDDVEGTAEGYDDDQEHDALGGSDDLLHEPTFDPAALGLKEINNLAHFGVSSHKPGNGVAELLSDDPEKYWQSDGQQPHLLTIHFLRRVEIRAIRFYVDYTQDESYTPTNIVLYAGTGQHDLLQFAEMPLTNPVGWQDVPIANCGGGHDGNSLSCWVVQMLVKENHQNGKDTHIRGIKIYALDENTIGGTLYEPVAAAQPPRFSIADRTAEQVFGPELATLDEKKTFQELLDSFDRNPLSGSRRGDRGCSNFPDFMRDPEIR
ncbi:putative anaphase-promoting complex subunit 10 [Cladorrhinum sp. PSN259]|nr:putative anaphase-promoting complex subunit 10 [Cladorrhinum sp. PSN259]